MTEVVKTPEFRVSYPALFKPRLNELAKRDQFEVTMLFPKGADLSALKQAMKAVAKERWGDNIPADLKTPFKKQDAKAAEGAEGYEAGAEMLVPWTTTPPGIVGTEKDPMTGKLKRLDASDIGPGDYACATVHFYAYPKPGVKGQAPGISCGLNNVQKTRDGTPLGGRTRPEDDFEPVSGAAGGEAAGSADSIFE